MIAHLDCSSGVSGDKFLGALLDAGLPEADLRACVASLGVPDRALRVERVRSHGIAAVRASLDETSVADGEVPLRHLAEIRELVAGAALPERVAARALSVFELLAQAEAKVHGTSVDEVHFHEVGALDSILDIVGVALGLDVLDVGTLVATPPALGSGAVPTSHGQLPVPAPATAELLIGIPVTGAPPAGGRSHANPEGELTTPTGAALLREFANGFGACPPMTPARIGYGAGSREIGRPNVCRIIVGVEAPHEAALLSERVVLLETNLDHLSPEATAFACEQLLAEGALDVWQVPVVMKKGRAAYVLSVLCAEDSADRIAARTVVLTGTLGVRRTDLPRYAAVRQERAIDTPWGRVRVKVGPEGAAQRMRAEYEDVARIARETGRAFGDVAQELAELARTELKDL